MIARTVRAGTRVTALLAGAALALSACNLPNENGKILELEVGRNGVKVEVRDANGDYETYLIPDTECEQDEYVQDCADADDYLVPPRGAVPGLNGSRDRDDDGD